MILGFDGSGDQNVFVAQKGLESKVDAILRRISQMQKISCSGSQLPTVRVSVVALTPSGPVEAFDFAEYQPELFEKFQNMRAQHPYVLTADTLKLYQNKFRQASLDNVKVRVAVSLLLPVSSLGFPGQESNPAAPKPPPTRPAKLFFCGCSSCLAGLVVPVCKSPLSPTELKGNTSVLLKL